MRAALERMPSVTDRAILLLRIFVGLSLRQISGRLKISYEKVRERYQQGLRHMERQLGGWL